MNSSDYLQWYYLMYLGPGATAMLVLLLSAFSGGGRHRAGHRGGARTGGSNHAHAHSGGSGIKHGGSSGIKHSGGSGVKHGGARTSGAHGHRGAQAKGGGRRSSVRAVMHGGVLEQLALFFGFGRVPMPFLIGGALMGWGFTGFWATQYWVEHSHATGLFWLPALGEAVAGAIVAEKFTAAIGSRLLPQTESCDVSNVDLCGLTGTVVYPIGEQRGRIHVYDDHGTLHEARARLANGEGEIARGKRALIVDYDPAADQLIVEAAS